MNITPLALDGVHLVDIEPHTDERGYFARTFCKTSFAAAGLETDFTQHSVSHNLEPATLRGLHYQEAPFEEVKLVRCSRGRVFDVVVDIRRASPTYGRWLGFELSADNGVALYIPGGFAHGFVTLDASSDVTYMINRDHVPGQGRTLRWNDPDLAIQWPLQPQVMSAGDRNAPGFLAAAAARG